jgi:hypothetical protein
MPTTQTVDDMDRLESVCRELDDLTLLYLDKLNQYTQSRTATTHTLEKVRMLDTLVDSPEPLIHPTCLLKGVSGSSSCQVYHGGENDLSPVIR